MKLQNMALFATLSVQCIDENLIFGISAWKRFQVPIFMGLAAMVQEILVGTEGQGGHAYVHEWT